MLSLAFARIRRRLFGGGWPGAELALVLGGLVVGVGIACGFAVLAMHLRTQSIRNRSADLETAALVLAAQADSSLQSLETVETGLIEQMQGMGITTAGQFSTLMSAPEMQRSLEDRVAALNYVNAVALVDAHGGLVAVSRVWPAPELNFRDRDYFAALTSKRHVSRFVSEPVQNRVSGDWSVYIARRFDAPDGTLLGIVLGAINLDYFQRLFAAVAPSPDSNISLYRDDGQMLLRHPPANPFLEREQRAAAMLALRFDEVQPVTSPVDGRQRLVIKRSLAHYPVVLIMGRTVSAALKPWWQEVRYLVAATALLDVSLVGLVLLGIRHLRRGRLLEQERMLRDEAELARVAAVERERHGQALAAHNRRFSTAVSHMSQGLGMFDADHRLLICNPSLLAIFALPTDVCPVGTPLRAMLRHVLRRRRLRQGDIRSLLMRLGPAETSSGRASFVWDISDGRAYSTRYERMPDCAWLMTFEDVTDRRRSEAQIAHMAHHDALTGLPNRALFQERLAAAAARGRRGVAHALLCLDLDRFKQVNDTLGHPMGDALLREVTSRLLRCVRETDTVARLGGDEFAIIQSDPLQPESARVLAGRVIDTLAEPYSLAGQCVVVGASVGIALLPEHGVSPEDLLRRADLALYRAKAEGRGRHCLFSLEMDSMVQGGGAAGAGVWRPYYDAKTGDMRTGDMRTGDISSVQEDTYKIAR